MPCIFLHTCKICTGGRLWLVFTASGAVYKYVNRIEWNTLSRTFAVDMLVVTFTASSTHSCLICLGQPQDQSPVARHLFEQKLVWLSPNITGFGNLPRWSHIAHGYNTYTFPRNFLSMCCHKIVDSNIVQMTINIATAVKAMVYIIIIIRVKIRTYLSITLPI